MTSRVDRGLKSCIPSSFQNPPTNRSSTDTAFAPVVLRALAGRHCRGNGCAQGLRPHGPARYNRATFHVRLPRTRKQNGPHLRSVGRSFWLVIIRTIPFVLADRGYRRMSKTHNSRFAGELDVSDKIHTRRSVDRRLVASFQTFGRHIQDR